MRYTLKEILNVPIVLTIHGIYYEKEILIKYLPGGRFWS